MLLAVASLLQPAQRLCSLRVCAALLPNPHQRTLARRRGCRIEQAFTDDMSAIHRPVIRLPDNGDTLFTRIEPANPHSSMVFKLR